MKLIACNKSIGFLRILVLTAFLIGLRPATTLAKFLTFHGTPTFPAASLKLTYEYDALNRVKRVIDDTVATGRTTTYDYDEVGNLESYRLPNNQRVDLKYDELNRLDSIEHTTGSQIARFDYTVSATGTRRALSEYIQGFGSRNITWQYDQIYRLARETISGVGPAGSVTYDPQPGYSDSTGYEPNGNRRDRTVALSPSVSGFNSRSYSYNSKDWLTTVGDNYDANGNTTSSSDLGGTFAYNFEDRLISRTGGGLSSITIIYDGDGNRIRKTVGSATTHYLVDDRNLTGYAQVLEETATLNGAAQRYYVYGLDLINHHCNNSGVWETRYFGYDGQGSARFLTDHPASGSAQITDRYTYDAFGTLIWTSGSTPNNYRYTGEQFDPDLNLYYLRARYYNANTGRFFNADTYEGVQNDPGSLHKYLYCADDPVNRIDPSGNDSLISVVSSASIQFFLRTSQFVAAHPVYSTLGAIAVSVAFPQLEAIPPGHPSPLDEMAKVGRIIRQGIARGLAKVTMNNHHPLPKFLGGDRLQDLIRIPQHVHRAFHELLDQRLQMKGFPLGGLGGAGNSAKAWAAHFAANPGSQNTAFEAVLEAARETDVAFGKEIAETGTTITQAVWKSIVEGKYTSIP